MDCRKSPQIEFKNLDDFEDRFSRPKKPLQPLQPYFFKKKLPHPVGLIITGSRMNNAGHFLWNGSSKIKTFP